MLAAEHHFKQHTNRHLRGEIWPPGFFHPLIDKKGPTTHGDAIKGSVSLAMMNEFDRLRDRALGSATDRLSGSFAGVGTTYNDVNASDDDGTDTDTSNGDIPVARNIRDDGDGHGYRGEIARQRLLLRHRHGRCAY